MRELMSLTDEQLLLAGLDMPEYTPVIVHPFFDLNHQGRENFSDAYVKEVGIPRPILEEYEAEVSDTPNLSPAQYLVELRTLLEESSSAIIFEEFDQVDRLLERLPSHLVENAILVRTNKVGPIPEDLPEAESGVFWHESFWVAVAHLRVKHFTVYGGKFFRNPLQTQLDLGCAGTVLCFFKWLK